VTAVLERLFLEDRRQMRAAVHVVERYPATANDADFAQFVPGISHSNALFDLR
jgi:hypothetical protein